MHCWKSVISGTSLSQLEKFKRSLAVPKFVFAFYQCERNLIRQKPRMRSRTYVDDLTLKADVFYDALDDVVIRLRGRRSLAAVVHEELGATLPPGGRHASVPKEEN